MPKPRKEQVSLAATPYYHCVSRCVRKAFLCGFDLQSDINYEHRRAWLESELLNQAQVFAIDIAAYAIMSNHYHVVLHINKQQAEKLMPFMGNPRNNMPEGLPFRLTDYLALIDLTGRAIRDDKRGYIEKHQPEILIRLGIDANNWLTMTQEFEKAFKDLVGEPNFLNKATKLLNRKRRSAFKNCEMLLT